jgi:hypothetical protein
MQKAKVEKIRLASDVEIDGLYLPDGSYGVAVSQVASLFFITPNNATKTVKSLLGIDSSLLQIRSELYSGNVNYITLPQFEKVLFKLAVKGNERAIALGEILVGLSLEQLFSDTFGVRFDKEERKARINNRRVGKSTRKTLTDVIKDWCDSNNCTEKVQPYCIYCSDQINLLLFQMKASEMKEAKNLGKADLLRDNFNSEELRRVEAIEQRMIERIILDNMKPTDAIKIVISDQNKLPVKNRI